MDKILKEIDTQLKRAENFKDYKDETFYDGFVCALKLIRNEILNAHNNHYEDTNCNFTVVYCNRNNDKYHISAKNC